MIADSVIQIMSYITAQMQAKVGKMDTAMEYKYFTNAVYLNIFAIFVVLLIGAFGLMACEGWTFAEALYFAVETSTVSSRFL
jgi:nitrate reductase NapE component